MEWSGNPTDQAPVEAAMARSLARMARSATRAVSLAGCRRFRERGKAHGMVGKPWERVVAAGNQASWSRSSWNCTHWRSMRCTSDARSDQMRSSQQVEDGAIEEPKGDATQVIHNGKLLPSIAGERYRKRERIKTSAEFHHAQRKGQTAHLKYFVINCVSNTHRQSEGVYCTRIGMVVSKKISKKAVVRNRVRRRIRDIFRKNKTKFPARHDVVFIPRGIVVEATYAELEQDVLAWAQSFDPNAKPKSSRRYPKRTGGTRRPQRS